MSFFNLIALKVTKTQGAGKPPGGSEGPSYTCSTQEQNAYVMVMLYLYLDHDMIPHYVIV